MQEGLLNKSKQLFYLTLNVFSVQPLSSLLIANINSTLEKHKCDARRDDQIKNKA